MDQPYGPAGLEIDAAYYNMLDIRSFMLMLKDPSYCYKFYWLEAIVNLIAEGVTETTFNDIIDEMICNAWYSVREFHIHLSGFGPNGEVRDGLERAVLKLTELSDLSSSASKVEIKNAIRRYGKDLKQAKEQLTNMVPYRAMAGFFANAGLESVPWDSVVKMKETITSFSYEVTALPYTLGGSSKLLKEVRFHPDWIRMIRDYTVPILGWIQYEKVKWLQSNNPEVRDWFINCSPWMRKQGNWGRSESCGKVCLRSARFRMCLPESQFRRVNSILTISSPGHL